MITNSIEKTFSHFNYNDVDLSRDAFKTSFLFQTWIKSLIVIVSYFFIIVTIEQVEVAKHREKQIKEMEGKIIENV